MVDRPQLRDVAAAEFGRDAPAASAGSTGGGTVTATRTQAQTETKVLPQWASVLLAVLAVGMSVLIVWQLYRIGDAGAHAVWSGTV